MNNSSGDTLSEPERSRLAEIQQKFDSTRCLRPQTESHPRGELSDEDLLNMARLLSTQFDPVFTSHRPILGRYIIAFKQRVIGFLDKMLRTKLAQQTEFNYMTFNLALKVQKLEQRVFELEQELRNKP